MFFNDVIQSIVDDVLKKIEISNYEYALMSKAYYGFILSNRELNDFALLSHKLFLMHNIRAIIDK